MKKALLGTAAIAALTSLSHAASIVWVSDMFPIGSGTSDNTGGTTNGVFGAGAGPYADQGILNLLTAAGHTVTRFNPADGTTPLSSTEIATLNAADLVIIGRSIASASFDAANEALAWNTSITKPLISTNTYMTRNNRLGWFVGSTQPDQVANALTFPNPTNAVSAYLIGATPMTGNTTTASITEAITFPGGAVDIRGISEITDAPVTGARVIATTTVGAATGYYIVDFPAGTTVGNGTGPGAGQTLGGYRMQFLAGNRESGTAPDNAIGSAGFENLTPDGEQMFLRAVRLALNYGAVPVPEPGSLALLGLAATTLLRRRRA